MSHRSSGARTAVLFGDSLISQMRAAEFTSVTVSESGDSLSRAAIHLVRTFRISRVLTGIFLILHGLAHSRAGTVLIDPSRSWRLFEGTILGTVIVWVVGALWAVSMLGFVAGGLGLLGVVGLRRYSRRLVFVAAVASVLLLALAAKPYALLGAVIDIVLFVLLGFTEIRLLRGQWIWHRTLLEEVARPAGTPGRARRIARTSGNVIAWIFLAYVTSLVVLRPWHLTWGTTAAEREMTLPGDGMAPRVAATHAVTIDAPVSAVWPWLVQIGQDRGGFYSYSSIENMLLGAGIRNADRIHPEWQELREGDFVRSARRDWLGGRFAEKTGWWVTDVEPQRSITLLGGDLRPRARRFDDDALRHPDARRRRGLPLRTARRSPARAGPLSHGAADDARHQAARGGFRCGDPRDARRTAMTHRPQVPAIHRRRWPQALTIVLLAMLAWLTAWLVIRLA